MRPYTEAGTVEIVDWEWQFTDLLQQEASENGCIQRYKGR
jgi:hypothetical protein